MLFQGSRICNQDDDQVITVLDFLCVRTHNDRWFIRERADAIICLDFNHYQGRAFRIARYLISGL